MSDTKTVLLCFTYVFLVYLTVHAFSISCIDEFDPMGDIGVGSFQRSIIPMSDVEMFGATDDEAVKVEAERSDGIMRYVEAVSWFGGTGLTYESFYQRSLRTTDVGSDGTVLRTSSIYVDVIGNVGQFFGSVASFFGFMLGLLTFSILAVLPESLGFPYWMNWIILLFTIYPWIIMISVVAPFCLRVVHAIGGLIPFT